MLQSIKKAVNAVRGFPSNSDYVNLNTQTPDLWKLEKKFSALVLIPDECMEGHYMHEEILGKRGDDWQLCSPVAYTCGVFSFYKKRLGKLTQAVPLPPQEGTHQNFRTNGCIMGELYAVRPDPVILRLDKYKDNGKMFIRYRVNVQVPHTEIKVWGNRADAAGVASNDMIQLVHCWMYLGVNAYWQDHMDGGFQFDQVSHFHMDETTHCPDFYHFNKEDYV